MIKYIFKNFKRNTKNSKIINVNKRRKITLNNKIFSKFKKRKNQLNFKFDVFNIFKSFKNKSINYYIFLFFLLLILISFIIFWPVFKLKIINISKNDDITNINIAYNSIDDIRWKHIFLIDEKIIFNKIITYQQNIKDIDINIILPNKLKILIESYKWLFYTNINNKNYLVTENWALVPLKNSINNWEINELIIKTNLSNNFYLDYKKIFDEKQINKIYTSVIKLKNNLLNIWIKKIIYYEIEQELHIKLKNNVLLIYSLDENTYNQIEKTVIFNKEFKNINWSDLIYIDFRIKNKVFYCNKDEEKNCNNNIKRIYN